MVKLTRNDVPLTGDRWIMLRVRNDTGQGTTEVLLGADIEAIQNEELELL